MVYTYSVVITGFAARLTAEEVADMKSMDGFLYAHPEKIRPLHTTYTPHLLGLDQYNSLWQHSSKGEGIIVGVFDTGIVPKHPSFADPTGLPEPPLKWRGRCDLPSDSDACSNKLIGAQHFMDQRWETPIDTTGHGTHVAGIAVGSPVYDADVNGLASGTASGMAPSAHLAVYKVCQNRGCPDSNGLKGMEQGILDGIDVIQISNGAPEKFYLSGNIKGTFRAVDNGIIAVCSAQNSGPTPSIISNDAPWIITVGAASTDRRETAVLRLGNGMEFIGESAYQPKPSGVVDLPLVYPGVKDTDLTLACQEGSMIGFNVTGKIVLCGIGFNDPVEKSKIVKKAGGAAMVVMNQVWDGDTVWAHPFVIPAIRVRNSDALKIVNYFRNEKNPTGTITFRDTEYGTRPSPTVATFSSRGPSMHNGGILKPDVIAPGVNILSAWAFDVSPNATSGGAAKPDTFNFASGTSMAAPHVSGIVALLKKSHPTWSPAMIKSALMTTAYMVDRDGQRITDDGSNKREPANAFAIGAGHVNPTAANDPGLVYDTRVDDYIPYLCGLKGLMSISVGVITNRRVSCAKKMEAKDLNYPAILVSIGAGSKNVSVPRTVTNVGLPSSTYKASVIEPNGVKVEVIPNNLKFESVGEEKNFTVELTLRGNPPGKKDVWEGRLNWVSENHKVSSPIVVIAK
ncbi:hypothetical protein HPP92_013600 [Vanilla planifolia]|uniref:Subtilisin-like protease SBT1.2 n=1 Tax=Vanilla planifolia TaxID=51239 RepID=A0A835QV75_VANPL|nr:hypothetical protein HPP92_013600 [Vanilla planifolia]